MDASHPLGLFLPNVHSSWRVSFRDDVSPYYQRNICAATHSFNREPNRGFPSEPFRRVAEGIMSKSFVARETLQGSPYQDFLYQVVPESRDLSQLERRASVQAYLFEKRMRVPNIFKLVVGLQGKGVKYTLRREGDFYQRMAFIPGDHFRGMSDELASAAREIGRLHCALREYPEMKGFSSTSFGDLAMNWEGFLAEKNKVASFLRDKGTFVSYLGPQVKMRLEWLEGQGILSKQLVHADLHPQNFIMADGEVRAVIDFDNVCFGTLGMDVANACHRLVRQYVIYQEAPWEESLAKGVELFLKTYLTENPWFEREVSHLSLFMEEILLRKLSLNLEYFATGRHTEEVALSEAQKFIGLLLEVREFDRIL